MKQSTLTFRHIARAEARLDVGGSDMTGPLNLRRNRPHAQAPPMRILTSQADVRPEGAYAIEAEAGTGLKGAYAIEAEAETGSAGAYAIEAEAETGPAGAYAIEAEAKKGRRALTNQRKGRHPRSSRLQRKPICNHVCAPWTHQPRLHKHRREERRPGSNSVSACATRDRLGPVSVSTCAPRDRLGPVSVSAGEKNAAGRPRSTPHKRAASALRSHRARSATGGLPGAT